MGISIIQDEQIAREDFRYLENNVFSALQRYKYYVQIKYNVDDEANNSIKVHQRKGTDGFIIRINKFLYPNALICSILQSPSFDWMEEKDLHFNVDGHDFKYDSHEINYVQFFEEQKEYEKLLIRIYQFKEFLSRKSRVCRRCGNRLLPEKSIFTYHNLGFCSNKCRGTHPDNFPHQIPAGWKPKWRIKMNKDEKAIKDAIDNIAKNYPDIPREEISKDVQDIFNLGDRIIPKLIDLQMDFLKDADKEGYCDFVQIQTMIDIGQRFLQGNIGVLLETNPSLDIDKIENSVNQNMKKFFDGLRKERDAN